MVLPSFGRRGRSVAGKVMVGKDRWVIVQDFGVDTVDDWILGLKIYTSQALFQHLQRAHRSFAMLDAEKGSDVRGSSGPRPQNQWDPDIGPVLSPLAPDQIRGLHRVETPASRHRRPEHLLPLPKAGTGC